MGSKHLQVFEDVPQNTKYESWQYLTLLTVIYRFPTEIWLDYLHGSKIMFRKLLSRDEIIFVIWGSLPKYRELGIDGELVKVDLWNYEKMTERFRSQSYSNTDFKPKKIGEDLGPGKTLFILVIVVGCFAVLCPNVFYPMLFGSQQHHIKPSPIDRTTGKSIYLLRIVESRIHFWRYVRVVILYKLFM